MPAKGVSNNPAGKPKGTQNRTTKTTREALKKALAGHIKALPQYLDKIENPKDKVDALAKILPYILPKMKEEDPHRVEVTQGVTPPITWRDPEPPIPWTDEDKDIA